MEIILIRHGKPTSADNPVIDVCEYTHWIRRYNASDVAKNSRPKNINEHYKYFYTVSSDLKRAIHSAGIYVGKSPEKIDKLYREMEIPRYKFPLKLKAWNWVYFSRILWMLGVKGSFESFKKAKQRADKAADKLIEIAQQQDKVVLFGHGFMNRYIRKSLIKKGWVLNSKSNAYWGVTSFEI
jgi:broad specificity phosphatase PhoE